MAREITLINASSVLPQAVGTGVLATKSDVSDWTAITIECSVTNGATAPVKGRPVVFNYVFSNISVDAADAPATFSNVNKLTLILSDTPLAVKSVVSSPITISDNYLYSWFTVLDPLLQAVTVNTAIIDTTDSEITIPGESTVTVTGLTTFTYSGARQGPGTADHTGSGSTITYEYEGADTTSYGPSAVKPINAGTYTVVATLPADVYHNGAESEAFDFEIEKAASTVTVTGLQSFTYSGAAQGPATSTHTGSGGAISYSYEGDGETSYGPSATKPTSAGDYTVVATSVADDNYNGADSNPYAFSIEKADSTIVATGLQTFVYSGLAQGPATSTKTGSTGAITYAYSGVAPTTYGPSATRPTVVGTYKVVVTLAGDDNYNGATSANYNFSITKATPTATVTNTTPYSYTGDPVGPNAVVTSPVSTGAVTWSYEGTDETEYSAATRPTDAGTYTAQATVAADANCLAVVSDLAEFSIVE